MSKSNKKPDYIFSVSWEVCNKVGGIYTVLSTATKALKEKSGATLIYIGPDLHQSSQNPLFLEDNELFSGWRKIIWENNNLKVRTGRWNIPTEPLVILVDFNTLYPIKNLIYKEAWELFSVNSLHAYGDYDEASMFSYSAFMVVKSFYEYYLTEDHEVVYHAHEWMTGLGALFIKQSLPQIATVFTTHATSIGRSIAGNNKPLYDYFEGYNGDQMAYELNMESKHSVEKQTATRVDCFTTVSSITARECRQLLEKEPDVITVNGFEDTFVPSGSEFFSLRNEARRRILTVAGSLMGCQFNSDTVIVGTGGRYEYRNKGIDLYIEALSRLRSFPGTDKKNILALINVPGWVSGPRADLEERLGSGRTYSTPLPSPFITHDLYNADTDLILSAFRRLGFRNLPEDRIKVLFVPCYLNGSDGIMEKTYYDLLIGQDIAVYPSYYEPWGYTPLESAAFRIPTITTNLAGFGQWVKECGESDGKEEKSVCVIERTDSNWHEAASEIAAQINRWAQLESEEMNKLRSQAHTLSQQALWSSFIDHYMEAFSKAIDKSHSDI